MSYRNSGFCLNWTILSLFVNMSSTVFPAVFVFVLLHCPPRSTMKQIELGESPWWPDPNWAPFDQLSNVSRDSFTFSSGTFQHFPWVALRQWMKSVYYYTMCVTKSRQQICFNAFLKRTWNRLTLKLKHNTFINWLEIVLCQIVRCKMTIYPEIVPFRLVRWQDTRQTSLGVNLERGGWLVRFIKKGKAPLRFVNLPTSTL